MTEPETILEVEVSLLPGASRLSVKVDPDGIVTLSQAAMVADVVLSALAEHVACSRAVLLKAADKSHAEAWRDYGH